MTSDKVNGKVYVTNITSDKIVAKELIEGGLRDILPRTKVRGFLPQIPGNCASTEPLADPVLRSSTVDSALPTLQSI